MLKSNSVILSKTVMDFSPLIRAAGLVALSPLLDSNLPFLSLPFASEMGRNWRKTPDEAAVRLGVTCCPLLSVSSGWHFSLPDKSASLN